VTEGLSQIRIWCLLRGQFAHVKPVEEHFGPRAEFIYDDTWDRSLMLSNRPDLVLCVNDYPYEISQCLDAARKEYIPSLVLQDGILEWRCQYENPLFGAGGGAPQHQPVLADKIACIGNQSARQIAAWGNLKKVEVTGMPSLDYVLKRKHKPVLRPGCRLLVMTAKKPGFTPEQTARTLQSLKDVKSYIRALSDVEVIWRTSKNVAQMLGIDNQLRECSSYELVDLIERVDAVITTPSTAILEAMLLNRPVAALDYHNVPRFVSTSWTISARDHIPKVIAELLNPPPRKMAFQRDCLMDCLACADRAAPRVGALIEQMIAFARKAKNGQEKQMPLHLLSSEPAFSLTGGSTLGEFYPENPLFFDNDVVSLQVRLARLQKRNEEIQKELNHRGIGYGVYVFGRHLANLMKSKTTKNA
jgi:hypothetical protein